MSLALIGHSLERLDVTLFAYVLPLLMPLFFPDSLSNSLSISLAAFEVSNIARPFGTASFGQLGDRFGRKSVFLYTILLTTLATSTIGFLPTYATIGILAPILVMICRFLQGLAAGAEFVVGSVFVLEHHPDIADGLAELSLLRDYYEQHLPLSSHTLLLKLIHMSGGLPLL